MTCYSHGLRRLRIHYVAAFAVAISAGCTDGTKQMKVELSSRMDSARIAIAKLDALKEKLLPQAIEDCHEAEHIARAGERPSDPEPRQKSDAEEYWRLRDEQLSAPSRDPDKDIRLDELRESTKTTRDQLISIKSWDAALSARKSLKDDSFEAAVKQRAMNHPLMKPYRDALQDFKDQVAEIRKVRDHLKDKGVPPETPDWLLQAVADHDLDW